MTAESRTTPAFPYNGLTRVEETLPSSWYVDPAHFERELEALWSRAWVYLCRASDIAGPQAFRTAEIGRQGIILVRDEAGVLRGFHNACRHRGSVLCTQEHGRFEQKLITCPYHRWAYDLRGALVRTSSQSPAPGFAVADYPLYPVAVAEWRGFVFVNLAGDKAPPFAESFAREPGRFDRWPLEDLVLGHSHRSEIACNWKVFWENFSECLHCPGVHPDLCRLVPIYGRGFMGEYDDPDWARHADSDDPRHRGGLRRGAETWSRDGSAHGRVFPDLGDAVGHAYITSLPSMFMVGHVDYVRTVRLRPLAPERTELTADWYFPAATLADPGFDLENVVAFGRQVIEEDAAACELNQRGLRSRAHAAGVLMPEEFAVKRFNDWVREGLDPTARPYGFLPLRQAS